MSAHSKLPWRMVGRNPVLVVSGAEHVVARMMSTEQRDMWADMEANAAFLVNAANSVDALREALQAMVTMWERDHAGTFVVRFEDSEVYDAARAALALAAPEAATERRA